MRQVAAHGSMIDVAIDAVKSTDHEAEAHSDHAEGLQVSMHHVRQQ